VALLGAGRQGANAAGSARAAGADGVDARQLGFRDRMTKKEEGVQGSEYNETNSYRPRVLGRLGDPFGHHWEIGRPVGT
jgi:hypothetical protein